MKVYSKKEIDKLIEEGKTGDYNLIIHSADLIKLAHAIAYNAQQGTPSSLVPLGEQWKEAVEKHLIKVFGNYIKLDKIHILKDREEDA